MYQIIFMAFKNIPKLGFFGMQTYYASMHLATLVGMHTYSFVAVKSDF
jgi:hypothetical protein